MRALDIVLELRRFIERVIQPLSFGSARRRELLQGVTQLSGALALTGQAPAPAPKVQQRPPSRLR